MIATDTTFRIRGSRWIAGVAMALSLPTAGWAQDEFQGSGSFQQASDAFEAAYYAESAEYSRYAEDCLSCGTERIPSEDLDFESKLPIGDRLLDFALIRRMQGDLACRSGDDDCNVCAPDVRDQFRRAAANASGRMERTWRFEEWSHRYWPGRPSAAGGSVPVRPYDTLDPDTGTWEWLGVPSGHVQGFVRTNSPAYPYVGSHSNKGDDHFGSVFVIASDREEGLELTALHTTVDRHPSGVQVIGDHAIVGDAEALRVIDLSRPHDLQPDRLRLPAPTDGGPRSEFGGGIAMARLAPERYLLMSSTPGNRENETKYHRMFVVEGSLSNLPAARITPIGSAIYTNPSDWPRGYAHNENASIVTECETGDLYAIHTSGQGANDAAGGLEGNGFWRLSKLGYDVFWNPTITPVDVFEMSQDAATCHLRSAGTVTVRRDGIMEFTCHQYFEDPDPSIASPFGDWSHDYKLKRWSAL